VIRRKLPVDEKLLMLQEMVSTVEEAKEILKQGVFTSTLKNSNERISTKQKQLHKLLVLIGRETKQTNYDKFDVLENAEFMRLEVSLSHEAGLKTRTILKKYWF
jgi:stalled ribosome rescue protein Dom34